VEFLRRQLFVIVCGLAAAGGIAAGVTGHQAMSKVRTELQSVAGLDRDLGSLQSKPVNSRQLEAASERIELIVEDYDKVVDRAKQLYDYQQLVPGALPYGEPQVLIEFRRKYHDAMNAMLDSLSMGAPATNYEVRTMQERIEEETQQRQAEAREQGLRAAPELGPREDEAGVLTEIGARFDAQSRADLYAAQRIYCYGLGFDIPVSQGLKVASSLDFNQSMRDVGTADAPYPDEVWRAQLGYWIQKDVVDVIVSLNAEAAKKAKAAGQLAWVGVMPVKEVISIRVPTDFISLGGGELVYGGAPQGYDEALPPGTSATVFTQSGSGEAYEVIQFTVKLVMDQRDIPRFVERLSNNSFHTLLRISYEVVPPNRKLRGKIYGSAPAAIVVMDFETILLGDVFRRLMPAEIRDQYEITCRSGIDECQDAPE